MINLSQYKDLAEIANALSHPVRLFILDFLQKQDCCYTGKLTELLPFSQATISQHLKVLKDAGLIQGELETPKIRYCLNPEKWASAQKLFGGYFQTKKKTAIKCK